jgi:hypothetical protein
MAQSISNLAVGAKVKDTGTTIYGNPIIWLKGDMNHNGYPTNSVTLVSEKIIKVMPVDGKEASNSDSGRQSYGNNRYAFANIRQWLNKTGTNWYTAMHAADAAPTTANVTYNPYDTVGGFLTGFSANMRAALLDTSLTVAKATEDGGGSETVADMVFLLSKAEVGLGAENGINEGSLIALFSAEASSRLCMPTAAAVANSNYTSESLSASQNWYWWLRSPTVEISFYVRHVQPNGSERDGDASDGSGGLRPALNLPSSILVSDAPDSDGAYVIQWNQAPTPPPSISVPSTIMSGQNANILWTAGSDPEGGAVTYELECSVNSGAYSNIYTGSGLSFSHAVTTAMNTVRYRVRSKDNVGEYSGYTTGISRTVVHNVAPSVSGSDSDLGVVTAPPSTSFSVNDTDAGDTVRVDMKLDGNTLTTIDPAVLQQVYTFELSDAQFFALASGQHTLQVVATDSHDVSTTRTVTFTRSVAVVDFSISPIETDAPAEKILISLQYYADPAQVQIQVCNNALDASPTWEASSPGLKHMFSNTTKTADDWAVGVRVTITPTPAYPNIYCSALNGSYV